MSYETLPVMFNYRLSTLSTLVPSERLAEFEKALRARIGDKMEATDHYVGGTVSFEDLDGDGVITIATEDVDCDYMA